MKAVLSRKPENARFYTSIDHHKTPGVVRQAFLHSQDPERSYRNEEADPDRGPIGRVGKP